MASKGDRSAAMASAPSDRARWEERSVSRTLEAGSDRILQRSRRLVEAAYALLEAEGLEGLTIRAVLKKSGLSRRAFYERFAGKDDLMLAVFEHTIRMAAARYREEIGTLADPMERLNLIVSYIVLGKGSPDWPASQHGKRRGAAMSREHLRLAEQRPDELQAALTPLIALIEQQMSEGMASGQVRSGDPHRLAQLVYNLVATTVHTDLLIEEANQSDRVQLAEDIWEFCRRAIAA